MTATKTRGRPEKAKEPSTPRHRAHLFAGWDGCQPRHLVTPEGDQDQSSFGDVEAVADRLDIELDTWQDALGRIVCSRNDAGDLLADTVALSVPRQSGKSFALALLVFADCWMHEDRTAVWTAHAFKPALEVFTLMRDWALQLGVDRKEIKTAAGNEAIHMPNGSRIVFAARARGVVRGFSGVTRLVLDEAQILGTRVMSDLVSTTRVAESPQVLLAGTPPKPGDDCEVFADLRERALGGSSTDLLWAEWGADPDVELDDRDAWHTANPSTRTPQSAIERERRLLTDADFRREALGIWPEVGHVRAVISAETWAELEATGPPDDVAPSALAIDMNHERACAVAACWLEGDTAHVELVALDQAAGDTLAVVEYVTKLAGRRIPVAVDSVSPAASMITALQERRVKTVVTGAADMAKACGLFYDDVHGGRLTHADEDGRGRTPLAEAVAGATRRPIGTAGGWGWDRRDAEANVAPLVAVTLARFAASVAAPRRRTGESVFR